MSERLTDEQLRHYVDNLPKGGVWQIMATELIALRTQVAALQIALEPFAQIAEHDIGSTEDDEDLFAPISIPYRRGPKPSVGLFRRALAALEMSGGVPR